MTEKHLKPKTSRRAAWRARQTRLARVYLAISDSDLRAHVLSLGISPRDWETRVLPAINHLRGEESPTALS